MSVSSYDETDIAIALQQTVEKPEQGGICLQDPVREWASAAREPKRSFAGATVEPKATKRRSDRVNLSLPVEVFGTDLSGKDFIESGYTKTVSRYGGTIVLNRALGPEQVLTIRRSGRETEARARVIGQVGILSDGNVYGIALSEPELVSNFWGIYFPPVDKTEAALARVLLECNGCRSREVAPLNEVEVNVFEANDRLLRHCRYCREWTLWRQPLIDTSREREQSMVPVQPGGSAPASREVELEAPASPKESEGAKPRARSTRVDNRRKYQRVRVSLKGCILLTRPEEEDLIQVLDMSRSGIRFRSHKKYVDNMWVQVAVPYTEGAGNIFQPARIMWRRPAAEGRFEYGLKYVKF